MWKYSEQNAYHSISLHDCRSNSVTVKGTDLIFHFPDGFWITPVSTHIDTDRPVKTGPSQLCFHGIFEDAPFDTIDIYKTIRVFRKPLLCRRLQPEHTDFLKFFNNGKYELEFLTEYHSPPLYSLYRCWIWKNHSDVYAECQFEITAKSIEYRWNDMQCNRQW